MTGTPGSVDASLSTDPAPARRARRGVIRALLALGGFERIAALAVIVALASLPMPWYRIRLSDRLQQSGFGSFGFAEAALIITLLAALVLLVGVGRGRRPPLPLHEGTLLALAGIWSALIVGVLMLDRPQAFIGDLPADYGLGYGIFVALGGSIVLAICGLRVRRSELMRDRWQGVSPEEEAAQSPSAASPPRSRR
jgi:hypothetical protein